MTTRNVTGSFAAGAENSASVQINGVGSLHLVIPNSGSVTLDASIDNGQNWAPVSLDAYGTPATFTASVRRWFWEPEDGVLYRLRCTAQSGGAILYALTQSP